jgi:hypothetical protein
MTALERPPSKRGSPLGPLIGFIVLIVVGGLAYLVSPAIVKWLTTTQLTFGSLGQVLPIQFPEAWPEMMTRIVVAVAIFAIVFIIAMIPIFAMVGTPKGEMDVDLGKVRDERKKKRR